MKFTLRAFLASLLFSLTINLARAGESPLQQRALGILQVSCARCHADGGSAARKFGSILDVDNLIARGIVVPGSGPTSKLVEEVESGDMPADGKPLTSEEIKALRDWISALAPPAAETPEALYAVARKALESRHPDQRRRSRFFAIRATNQSEAESQALALSKVLNSLSWEHAVGLPLKANPDGSLLRIDLSDFGWSADTWERIAGSLPEGGFPPNGADASFLIHETGTSTPVLWVDDFVRLAVQPPLYGTILKLPATQSGLESLLGIDVASDISSHRVFRSGFEHSGVALHNRVLERHETPKGQPFWISYDFADALDFHDLFEHPLDFRRSGGEIIFGLPNGLHAFMLVNAAGTSLDEAPTEIVQDPVRSNLAVRNGVSCMRCHAQGLLASTDEVRALADQSLNTFSREDTATLLSLYPPANDFKVWLDQDTARYQAALKKIDPRLLGLDPITPLAQPQ